MITEKEHIHMLHITRSNEKQLFEIKLPKNATKVTGILMNVQPSDNEPEILFALKVGDIKLRLNNIKNIFYAGELCAYEIMPDYEKLTGIQRVDFDDNSFSTRGTVMIPLVVDIETKDTIIAGSYRDTTNTEGLFPYQVKIYITYQVQQ